MDKWGLPCNLINGWKAGKGGDDEEEEEEEEAVLKRFGTDLFRVEMARVIRMDIQRKRLAGGRSCG